MHRLPTPPELPELQIFAFDGGSVVAVEHLSNDADGRHGKVLHLRVVSEPLQFRSCGHERFDVQVDYGVDLSVDVLQTTWPSRAGQL